MNTESNRVAPRIQQWGAPAAIIAVSALLFVASQALAGHTLPHQHLPVAQAVAKKATPATPAPAASPATKPAAKPATKPVTTPATKPAAAPSVRRATPAPARPAPPPHAHDGHDAHGGSTRA